MAEDKSQNRTMEVVKFAVPLVINLIIVAIAFTRTDEKANRAVEQSNENKVEIANIKTNNHERDVATVSYRASMEARVEKIETLTIDIHKAVVRDANGSGN